MAVGRYESARFPFLELTVVIDERHMQIVARIDTGFDGVVSVPSALIGTDAQPNAYRSFQLVNEVTVQAPVHAGTVQLGDLAPFPAEIVNLGDEILVGPHLIDRYGVFFDHGQRIVVEP